LSVDVADEVVNGAHDELLARAARAVLSSGGVREAQLSIAVLDDRGIRALNREHLGHDRPTDVIAFPLWESGETVVGDVYVGVEQARRQADDEGVTLEEELVRLVVHGTLHVLGWDHSDVGVTRQDTPMWRRQEELVRIVCAEAG
jgi:probable rRNA maturation factor